MILILPYLIRKSFNGITLFPFIILRHSDLKDDKVLINHESIHLRQQLELFILFFYFLYTAEFFWKLILYKNRDLAYRSISFEREAYFNQKNHQYLATRKFWAFTRYYKRDFSKTISE